MAANHEKYTPELGKKFVEIVRRGNFRESACAQVGISPRTMREWLTKASRGEEPYVGFVRDLDAAESEAEDVMVVAIRRAAIKDWRAAAWYLERRGPKRWGFKAQVEVSLQEELQRVLDVVEREVGGEAAARIFSALADSEARTGETPGAGPPASGGPQGPGSPVH